MAFKKFSVGNTVRVKEHGFGCCGIGCASFNDTMRMFIGESFLILRINPDGSYGFEDRDGLEPSDWSWSDCMLSPTSPAVPEKAMSDKISLVKLTAGQKAGLSKDDQALLEAGIIINDLELNNSKYVIDFLFNLHKAEIAKQALKDVVELKKIRKVCSDC